MKPAIVKLRLKDEEMIRPYELASVVLLSTDKVHGSESNNKVIHFKYREPGVLVNFSFKKMAELGFPPEQFLTVHKSFRVNAEHISEFHGDRLIVIAMIDKCRTEPIVVPVSEDYRPAIRKRLG